MHHAAGHADGAARLRPWSAEDGGWYIAQLSDPQIQRFTTERTDTTIEDFTAALDALNSDTDQAGFAIVEARTGELAGNLAASRDGGTADIHYWIAVDKRRRGLASDALAQMCRWIAVNWPGCEMVLHIDADNTPSQRVAEQAGFRWQQGLDRRDPQTNRTTRRYARSA
jgi:RimJ/RimL family protein N-acetyltransferase